MGNDSRFEGFLFVYMKVILVKNIPSLGKPGEVKDVSEGHASNFLLPRGLAVLATPDKLAAIARQNQAAEAKSAKHLEGLKKLKAELEKRTFTVKVKVGDKGQIFGAVREKDIADIINQKIPNSIEKSQVHITEPIKQLGTVKVTLKLGEGVSVSITINIEPA